MNAVVYSHITPHQCGSYQNLKTGITLLPLDIKFYMLVFLGQSFSYICNYVSQKLHNKLQSNPINIVWCPTSCL